MHHGGKLTIGLAARVIRIGILFTSRRTNPNVPECQQSFHPTLPTALGGLPT